MLPLEETFPLSGACIAWGYIGGAGGTRACQGTGASGIRRHAAECECRASTRARRKHATARGGRNGRIHSDCRLCGPAMAAHPVIKSEWNPELPPGTITAYRSRCGRFCFGHLPTQMQEQTFQGALLLAY